MKTTTVEIKIGNVSIRIEAPVDSPVVVAEVPKAESIVIERKSRPSGYTIPDRAPDHCSRCGAEGRRCNHELGGCIECRDYTDAWLDNPPSWWRTPPVMDTHED